jgi:hypothetical protein
MRPDKSDIIGDHGFRAAEYRQVTASENETRGQGVPPQAPRSPRSGRELRLNERLRRLLSQKRGPDAVMLSALSVALLCGLIGFAVHFMWVVAIIVMALALGFVIADSRRNRIDIANQRDEGKDD